MRLFGYEISIVKFYTLFDFLEEIIRLDPENRQKVFDLFTHIYSLRKKISGLENEIFNKTIEAVIELVPEEKSTKLTSDINKLIDKNQGWWKKRAKEYLSSFKTLRTDEEKAMLDIADKLGPLYKSNDEELSNLERLILVNNIFTNKDRKDLMDYTYQIKHAK